MSYIETKAHQIADEISKISNYLDSTIKKQANVSFVGDRAKVLLVAEVIKQLGIDQRELNQLIKEKKGLFLDVVV